MIDGDCISICIFTDDIFFFYSSRSVGTLNARAPVAREWT